jgi:hypothetical protein
MVNARLLPTPACLHEGEDNGAPMQQGFAMDNGNQPQDTTEVKAEDGQLYRSLARSFTEQLQKQEIRKKRINSLAFVLCTVFFLGLIVISYLSRG